MKKTILKPNYVVGDGLITSWYCDMIRNLIKNREELFLLYDNI